MVIVGMIKIEDPNEKATWFEVNSQILNACFTITAVMTQPMRFKLFIWTIKWYRGGSSEVKLKYAKKIETEMPDIILDCGGKRGEVAADSVAPEPVMAVSPISIGGSRADSTVEMTTRNESTEATSAPVPKIFTPTWKWFLILAFLNGQCIFQYPITVVQWMYIGKATERPAIVIALCLPISFLCGAIGGIWPTLMARDRKKKLETSV